MDRSARLHLVGRISYYVGWIALACGGFAHFTAAGALFDAARLPQRNLFELSVICFLICIASELRAPAATGNQMPSVAGREVAA